MRRVFLFIVTLLAVAGSQSLAFACSVCKCGDQAFFINNARLLPRGTWVISMENLYLNKSALQHEAIADDHHHDWGLLKLRSLLNVSNGEEPGIESQQQNNLQIVVNYGLTDRLMLMASLPYTFNRFSQGTERFRINGFGDPELMVMLHLSSFFNKSLQMALIAGVRLPLGETDYEKNGKELHAHDQIGSGAVAGTFGLQLSRLTGALPIFFSANVQRHGANNRNFRYGNVFRFNVATQHQLSNRFDLIAEINGRAASFDKEGISTEPHSGGTVVYFSPGLRFNFIRAFAFRGQAQIPVVEKLHGVQDEKTNLRAGLVWTL